LVTLPPQQQGGIIDGKPRNSIRFKGRNHRAEPTALHQVRGCNGSGTHRACQTRVRSANLRMHQVQQRRSIHRRVRNGRALGAARSGMIAAPGPIIHDWDARAMAGTVGWEPSTHPKMIEKTRLFARDCRVFAAGFVSGARRIFCFSRGEKTRSPYFADAHPFNPAIATSTHGCYSAARGRVSPGCTLSPARAEPEFLVGAS
jgi:hypothetical protein